MLGEAIKKALEKHSYPQSSASRIDK